MTREFEIPDYNLTELRRKYYNMGKNSHVGEMAVRIVELYFKSLDPKTCCTVIRGGGDLEVTCNGNTQRYEVKGTADKNISWGKLKVSSEECYNALINGMALIRVTNIGENKVCFHFLQYGKDFLLAQVARWSVKPVPKSRRKENIKKL